MGNGGCVGDVGGYGLSKAIEPRLLQGDDGPETLKDLLEFLGILLW